MACHTVSGFPPSSIPPIPADVSIPIIIVTPGTPLPQQQSQEKFRAVDPAPAFAMSFVPQSIVTFALEKHAPTSPPRQESALSEFEVPLVELALPATISDPEPVAAAQAVVETQQLADDADGETDDETEWEPVTVAAIPLNAPDASATEPAPVDESTRPAESVSVEQETAAEAHTPVDVPLPNIAEDGPEIIFHSYKPKDDDRVLLGYSEDEREHQFIYGEDDKDGDYEDDDSEEEETETKDEDEEEDEEDENNEASQVQQRKAAQDISRQVRGSVCECVSHLSGGSESP